MKFIGASVFAIALFSIGGCGGSVALPASPPEAAKMDVAKTTVTESFDEAPKKPSESDAVDAMLDTRKPGDFVSFRYSGSFRKTPVVLTEKIVSRDAKIIVMDMTMTEGAKSETLRVKMDYAAGARPRVVDVSKIVIAKAVGGKLAVEKSLPSDNAAYEAMMGKTVLAADDNEAILSTEDVTMTVAGRAVAAKRSTYRVMMGEKRAKMSVVSSEFFPWGDLGGEIVREDGLVMYRAELVLAGDLVGIAAPVESPTVTAKR